VPVLASRWRICSISLSNAAVVKSFSGLNWNGQVNASNKARQIPNLNRLVTVTYVRSAGHCLTVRQTIETLCPDNVVIISKHKDTVGRHTNLPYPHE